MANEVVKVVQQAGLVEKDTVQELRRWGAPIPVPPASSPEIPAEIAPSLIERAMQDEDFVQVKETDLEVLKQYLTTQEIGTLKLEMMDGKREAIDIVYGKTPLGEYVIPWTEGRIADLLEDCLVHLHIPDKGWVSLKNPRELYYGDRRVFTLWTAE
jgi:hypothetical protein